MHYNLEDSSTARAVLDQCINIIQKDEELIICYEQIKEANEKEIESLKAELETEKKLRQIVMQDLSDKSKELFDAELKHKLYKAKQEGLTQ